MEHPLWMTDAARRKHRVVQYSYWLDQPEMPVCKRPHDPGPETMQAYTELVRAQDEIVENASRRAREEEDRKAARRRNRRTVAFSPTVQYYAGSQFLSAGFGLRFGLWVWLVFVGISLGLGAFCKMLDSNL